MGNKLNEHIQLFHLTQAPWSICWIEFSAFTCNMCGNENVSGRGLCMHIGQDMKNNRIISYIRLLGPYLARCSECGRMFIACGIQYKEDAPIPPLMNEEQFKRAMTVTVYNN